MDSVDRQRQIAGLAVAAGQRETHIHSAVPAVQQPGMQQLIVIGLLGVIADQHNVSGWNFHCATGLGSDFYLSVARGYRTDESLFVRCSDMQFFLGGDLSDRRELYSNVSRKLGVSDRSVAFRVT